MIRARSSLRLLSTFYSQQYKFSKDLKRKLTQLSKQSTKPQTIPAANSTQPQSPPPQQYTLLKLPHPNYPHITGLSMNQQRHISLSYQLIPPSFLIFNCLLQVLMENPFTSTFFYQMWIGEKISSWLVISNLVYSSDQRIKYAIIGSIVAVNLLPTLSPFSMAGQILQIAYVLYNDTKTIREGTPLTDQQKKLMVERLKTKLFLYSILVSFLMLKIMYHYQAAKIQRDLKQIDEMNQYNAIQKNTVNSSQNQHQLTQIQKIQQPIKKAKYL